MARYTGPVCRLCRRHGEKLFLKGEKCYTPKCPLERRRTPPGYRPHSRPRKLSEYGLRLLEKQKAKRIYGVLERQFRRYFEMASKLPGLTGENLLKLLERRLDNVVYRLGFAESRPQARQLVCHGHFKVNGRRVNIPSYLVKPGDVISWKEGEEDRFPYQSAVQRVKEVKLPSWLSLDQEKLVAKVLGEPTREDIGYSINEQLIVEYYAR